MLSAKKRGLSTSSATSSSLRRIKLKRPFLIQRKGAMRKTTNGSSYVGTPEKCENYKSCEVLEGVSARKLINEIWQMNKIGKFSDLSQDNVSDIASYYKTKRHMKKELVQNKMNSISSNSTKNNCSAMQIQAFDHNYSPKYSNEEKMNYLNNLNNNLTASRETLKALIHIWVPEKTQNSTFSLLSSLYTELDSAHKQLKKVNKKSLQESVERETKRKKERETILVCFETLMEELGRERKLRKKAERLNKRLGVVVREMESSILEASEELERERKSRERVERVCKELVRGIGEDRERVEGLRRETVLLQEELERERETLRGELEREREKLQEELEIERENLQEELEREREILQEELERERENLLVADEWREERVQMKLIEAKFQFEEKNKKLEKLRNELEIKKGLSENRETEGLNEKLEAYIEGEFEIEGDFKGTDVNLQDEEKNKAIDQLRIDLQAYLSAKNTKKGTNAISEDFKGEIVKMQEIDSGEDSDIELEMQNEPSWNYENFEGTSVNLLDKERAKMYEKELEGPSWNYEQFEGTSVNLLDKEKAKMYEKELERYNLVKKLRDHMLAGSGFIKEQDKEDNLS